MCTFCSIPISSVKYISIYQNKHILHYTTITEKSPKFPIENMQRERQIENI